MIKKYISGINCTLQQRCAIFLGFFLFVFLSGCYHKVHTKVFRKHDCAKEAEKALFVRKASVICDSQRLD